jgi:hypothetical protein
LVFFGFDDHVFNRYGYKYPPIPLIKQMEGKHYLWIAGDGLDFLGDSRNFSKIFQMSPSLLQLLLCGFVYVLLSYLIGRWCKPVSAGLPRTDDGDGGKAEDTPPRLDLPPGVSWPTDVEKLFPAEEVAP